MAEDFCTNCGHKNPVGSNFCSSCGVVLETSAPDTTTITFHPIVPSDQTGDAVSESDDIGSDTNALVIRRGPNAGSRFALNESITTAGRHPESDIFLDDVTVSRRHVEVISNADGFRVRDVGSLNGTYVNRERIDEAPLVDGDEIQIGKFKLVFLVGRTSET
ncbi:MAG: FHA domain-containing protein [Actinomycetes bacterium]